MSDLKQHSYDVIILGGGPAGCATALALCQLGVSQILIVEAGNYKTIRVGECIPPDTRLLLEQLGIWEKFEQEKFETCMGSASSWGDNELGYNDFIFNPNGNGWHLDRRRFDQSLAQYTEEGGAQLLRNTRYLNSCRLQDSHFQLQLKQEGKTKPTTVKAKYIVDAGGNRSNFAIKQGAKRLLHDQLTCIYGFFNLPNASSFSKLTLLEATEYGWWYAAKLPDNQLAVAIATDSNLLKQHKLREWKHWLTALADTPHISQHLSGAAFKKDSLLIAPVVTYRLDHAAGDDWLAVGDAASAYDPISAQGIYKALSDSLQAAPVITNYLHNKERSNNYHNHIKTQYSSYMNNRDYFYNLEQRWSDSIFWSRRHKVKNQLLNKQPAFDY